MVSTKRTNPMNSPKTEKTKTRTGTVRLDMTRSVRASNWDDYEEAALRIYRTNHTDMMRSFMNDVAAGNYINMQGLRPETEQELAKFAEDLGITLQAAVDRILSEFLLERRRQRGAKK